MDSPETSPHVMSAKMLMSRLFEYNDFTLVSNYDTAWVSMVAKPINGKQRWLFPSVFQHLIDQQQNDGGWKSARSYPDAVLDSLAALLAICRHLADPYEVNVAVEDLRIRKSRAIYFLETEFCRINTHGLTLDQESKANFARILPLLQDQGVDLSLGREGICDHLEPNLKTIRGHSYFEIGNYDNMYFPEAQAEEAVLDEVIAEQASQISKSPFAITAEHLINCSNWDENAEAYLSRLVLGESHRDGGSAPAASFPSTASEISGIIATLRENGFTGSQLGLRSLDKASRILEDCLALDSGVMGCAPYTESDACSTAKAISALSLLGRRASLQGLVDRFEAREHFKTYNQECIPNFVTNCLVLKAFLDTLPNNSSHIFQIEKVAEFVYNSWPKMNEQIENQVNPSDIYPSMLMAEAFVRLVSLWERKILSSSLDIFVKEKVIISLFQAHTRILRSQSMDGSWGNRSCEDTAYAVITLAKLRSLTSAPRIVLQVTQAIEKGRHFLINHSNVCVEPGSLRIGKTSPETSPSQQAFLLAALQIPVVPPQSGHTTIEGLFNIPLAKLTIQTKYFARQAWSAHMPEWLVQACLVESQLFLPQLKAVQFKIFPEDRLVRDRCFEAIPLAWIAANYTGKPSVGPELMYQMMVITVLGRQIEDYMENVVGEVFAGFSPQLEVMLHDIFHNFEMENKYMSANNIRSKDASRSGKMDASTDVRSILHRFIAHILDHPCVVTASYQDQLRLRAELSSFLLGRVTQISHKGNAASATDTTAHSYAYAFLACMHANLNGSAGTEQRLDFLETPEQHYLVADMCRHMSLIGFMNTTAEQHQGSIPLPLMVKSRSTSFGATSGSHNSTGSVSSVSTASSTYENSPSPISSASSMSSFLGGSTAESPFLTSPSQSPIGFAQESLQVKRIIDHERQCLNQCLNAMLEAGVDQCTHNAIRLFVKATGLAEQIFQDPNIGAPCQTTPSHSWLNPACEIRPPPLPRKRNRGSGSATRTTIDSEHLTSNRALYPPVKTFVDNNTIASTSDAASTDRKLTPVPTEREWSWNKKPTHPAHRTSRVFSETSRIESIMSEIDDFTLSFNPDLHSHTQRSKRAASESDALWTQPKVKSPTFHQRSTTDLPSYDTEALKLARIRQETAHKLRLQAEKKRAKASQNEAAIEAAAQRRLANELQSRAMAEIRRSEMRQNTVAAAAASVKDLGWVKAPPPEGVQNVDVQKSKLRRAIKLGGPRWKAPF